MGFLMSTNISFFAVVALAFIAVMFSLLHVCSTLTHSSSLYSSYPRLFITSSSIHLPDLLDQSYGQPQEFHTTGTLFEELHPSNFEACMKSMEMLFATLLTACHTLNLKLGMRFTGHTRQRSTWKWTPGFLVEVSR